MKLTKFVFEDQPIRSCVDEKGNPWFVAKDICVVLDHTDVSMAVKRLDTDEKLLQTLLVSGQNRSVMVINESGLYRLVLTSRKPEAKVFKKWVTSEVLPSIRKTGSYAVKPSIPSHIESLRGWADALEENERKAQVIEAQQEQLEVQQPAVDLVERYLNAPETEGVQVIAKILGYSQKELVAFCEENDILYRKAKGGNLLPHQKWIDAGYFKVKTGERYGHAYTQTRFTTRGFKWISEQIPNRIPVAKSLFLDPNASNLHLH